MKCLIKFNFLKIWKVFTYFTLYIHKNNHTSQFFEKFMVLSSDFLPDRNGTFQFDPFLVAIWVWMRPLYQSLIPSSSPFFTAVSSGKLHTADGWGGSKDTKTWIELTFRGVLERASASLLCPWWILALALPCLYWPFALPIKTTYHIISQSCSVIPLYDLSVSISHYRNHNHACMKCIGMPTYVSTWPRT